MAHSQIAADKIKQETNGRMEIVIYPSSQLAGGDLTAMISQAISGAMQMYYPAHRSCSHRAIRSAASPASASRSPTTPMSGLAMDGDLGGMLWGVAEKDRLLLPGQGL